MYLLLQGLESLALSMTNVSIGLGLMLGTFVGAVTPSDVFDPPPPQY
jgi:hypothetical protein